MGLTAKEKALAKKVKKEKQKAALEEAALEAEKVAAQEAELAELRIIEEGASENELRLDRLIDLHHSNMSDKLDAFEAKYDALLASRSPNSRNSRTKWPRPFRNI